MKIYHYRKLERWPQEKAHLRANAHLGLKTFASSKVGDRRATFGLLEPTPEKWVSSIDFPGVWSNLTFNTGELLLELNIDPRQDSAFVLDQGHMRTMDNGWYLDTSPHRYHHETQDDALREYLGSALPIEEYISRQAELNYSLPEVVIKQDLALGKVQEATSQPVLEELLDMLRQHQPVEDLTRFSRFARGVLRDIRAIPELETWYVGYLAHHPEIQNEWKMGFGESVRSFKERFF